MAVRLARLSRRQLGRWLLAAPLTRSAGAQARGQDEPPSDEARFIAAHEASLTDEERAILEKSLTGQRKMLETIRAFVVPVGTPPALRFAPRLSRGRR